MWHALGGTFAGFRFKDYVDFKSCAVNLEVDDTDAPLVFVAGSVYQLVKRYQFGALIQDREITKPVQGTILLADASTPKTEGSDWTLDYITGEVTINFSPSLLTWGGEFDVPCRFASEFPVQILDKQIQSVAFVIEELRTGNEEVLT
jgi:uncharacterized protein (TIGR02217 family)